MQCRFGKIRVGRTIEGLAFPLDFDVGMIGFSMGRHEALYGLISMRRRWCKTPFTRHCPLLFSVGPRGRLKYETKDVLKQVAKCHEAYWWGSLPSMFARYFADLFEHTHLGFVAHLNGGCGLQAALT